MTFNSKFIRIAAALGVILVLIGYWSYRSYRSDGESNPPQQAALTETVDRGMSEEQLQLFRDRIAEFEKQAADNESAGTRDISVILQLGNLNYTMGELGTAAKWYRDILSTNPNDGPAHENLGQTLLEMGDYAGAEQEWRLALNVSAYEPIYLKLVELIAEHFPERQAEIQVILETAIANLGQTPGLLTRLGEWYADNGLYEEAVSHYEVASKLDPDDKAIEQRLKELRRLRVQQVP